MTSLRFKGMARSAAGGPYGPYPEIATGLKGLITSLEPVCLGSGSESHITITM